MRKGTYIALGALAALFGCETTTEPLPDPEAVTFELDFTGTPHGWEAGFSDYPPEWAEQMELESGHEPLPAELGVEGRGLYIAGSNQSDDLFMFWKGRVEGLEPHTTYRVSFEVELATEAPSECAGIGGAPGESVFVKVGATLLEPEPVVEDVGGLDYYRMNVDKGDQAEGGEDVLLVGHVGNANTDCLNPVWELAVRSSDEDLLFTTDATGRGWLFVGTDSGFEGRTRLFYTRYVAVFEPV